MNQVINELILNLFIRQPIFWIIVIGGLISSGVFYKKISGFFGEFWTKKELNKLPSNEYTILNNIMLKTNKSTHQIDHIVISKFGIFVVETKNYSGLIVGNKYKDRWIQYLGKRKYYINNPIHQNYGHIKALEKILNLDDTKFISVICILNQAKIKVNDESVVQLNNINEYIKSFNKAILNVNLDKIEETLKTSNIIDKSIRKQHIKNIKDNIKVDS